MNFQLISSTLGSLSNDWDLRVAALKQIQKSVDADSDLTPAELYEGIQIIAKPLAVQFTDLRSQIVKEAAATVTAVAKHFQGDFFVFAQVVVPPMIRVLKSSKGIMYNAANDAMLDIVDNCVSVELTNLLCGVANDKHPAVRENVLRYVGRILEKPNAAEDLNDDVTTAVEAALRRTIVDASGPVRTEARTAFHNYKRVFPVDAALMLASLDASLQRKLETAPRPSQAKKAESVRDRILKARLQPPMVPLAVSSSLLSCPQVFLVVAATPPRAQPLQPVPTPPPGNQAAQVVVGGVCPPSTPVNDVSHFSAPAPAACATQLRDAVVQLGGIEAEPEKEQEQRQDQQQDQQQDHESGDLSVRMSTDYETTEDEEDEGQSTPLSSMPKKIQESNAEVDVSAKPLAPRLGAAQRRPTTRKSSLKENASAGPAKAVPLKKKEFTPIAKRTRKRRQAAQKTK